MNFRNISAWSIRNPVVPIVLFIALVIAGLVSFMRMDIQQQPDVEFPMVIVQISQPGAAPTEIENQITQRIESAVRSITGVSTISSTASEGSSQTMIEFQLGEDINQAVNEVKNAVDRIRADLPDGVLEPQVFKANTSSQPIAYFAVETDDMTLEQLSWFIDDTVAKRLLGIEGMASVSRSGGVNREILVTLDPAQMQSLGVTAAQVNQSLRTLNVNAGGGRAEIGGTRQSVRVIGNAETAYELSQTDIAIGGGRTIKLADIATVSDAYGEITSKGKFNGRPVAVFSMTRARGASDVSVYDTAIEELRKLEAENPGVTFREIFTTVNYTKDQYESSMAAMVEGAILAVVATTFSIVAVFFPVGLMPGVSGEFFKAFGLTVVASVLMSLLVARTITPMVAAYFLKAHGHAEHAGGPWMDRYIKVLHWSLETTKAKAMRAQLTEVPTRLSYLGPAVIGGAVFAVAGHFAKQGGMFGQSMLLMLPHWLLLAFMFGAGFFICSAIVIAVGAWNAGRDGGGDFPAWALFQAKRARARLHDHRIWMIGVAVGALYLTYAIGSNMASEFFPTQDSDTSTAVIEMAPGTTLSQTEAVSDRVRQILADHPDVENVYQSIQEGSGRLMIMLRKDRAKTSTEIEAELIPQFQQIPDARIIVQSANNQQGSGTGRPVSIMLSGTDPALLEKTAATLVEQMKDVPQVVAPRISADMRRPEVIVKPRLDLAASLGVSTQALSQAIRIATIGEIDQNAAKFSLSDRQIPIRVRMPEEARRDIDNIANLPVPTVSGGSVPLSRVAEISFGSGPTTIQRYNQARRIFVGADLAPGVVKSEATTAINALPIMRNLPNGISNEPFGSDAWQQEMLDNLMVAVPAGILLVLAVLILLYHRVISPLVNMGSLFLAPFGGLLALQLTGQNLSMPVFIGVLMLFGIVAKNSILLIDFAIEEMALGKDKFAAIVEAGHKRAQPIVMTTVAMTAGMVPTAISVSGDGAWRAPMGTVVIGGLLMSTVLTLLIVPAAFSLADGLEKRLGPKLRKGLLTYEPHHSRPGEQDPERPVPAE
jgi:multidrug efflux pump subunit AcrB